MKTHTQKATFFWISVAQCSTMPELGHTHNAVLKQRNIRITQWRVACSFNVMLFVWIKAARYQTWVDNYKTHNLYELSSDVYFLNESNKKHQRKIQIMACGMDYGFLYQDAMFNSQLQYSSFYILSLVLHSFKSPQTLWHQTASCAS